FLDLDDYDVSLHVDGADEPVIRVGDIQPLVSRVIVREVGRPPAFGRDLGDDGEPARRGGIGVDDGHVAFEIGHVHAVEFGHDLDAVRHGPEGDRPQVAAGRGRRVDDVDAEIQDVGREQELAVLVNGHDVEVSGLPVDGRDDNPLEVQ